MVAHCSPCPSYSKQDKTFSSGNEVRNWLATFPKFSCVEVVEKEGEVLVRCEECHKKVPSREHDKMAAGVVVIPRGATEGSLKTSVIGYHYNGHRGKPSFHDREQAKQKSARTMDVMLAVSSVFSVCKGLRCLYCALYDDAQHKLYNICGLPAECEL